MTASGIRQYRTYWLAAAAIILAIAGTDVSAKLYRWVDEDGVVHYSDKLPPEHSKDAHEELNEEGQTLKDVERAKTEEERAAEERRREQAERERQEKAQAEARKRRHDQILLQTFTTERDLIITRDDRLEAIDSIINLTISNNHRLEEQIEETGQRIEAIKKSGREVPENMSQKMENLEGQLAKNQKFIESKREERRQVEAKFEADLKRFRELKGIENAEQTEQAESKDGASEKTPSAPATIDPGESPGGPDTAETDAQ